MKKALKLFTCLLMVLSLSACKKEEVKEEEKPEEPKVVAPATSTEELTSTLEKVETEKIDGDVIEFKETANVKEGDMIAVWIYSEPKFLGYFPVVVENGKKLIKGLDAALEKITIESGNHNIALVTEEGVNIGYVDIYIYEDGNMIDKEEAKIVKEETKTEVVNFTTKTETDANMASGQSKTTQEGVNGEKTVYYKVTYNSDGVEISREKVKEEVTKQPVQKIIKVGKADFNLNTAKVRGSNIQLHTCTKDVLDKYENSCNTPESTQSKAIRINDVVYIHTLNDTPLSKVIKTTALSSFLYSGTYNGKTYYFESASGGDQPEPLTQAMCNQYKLSCGRW